MSLRSGRLKVFIFVFGGCVEVQDGDFCGPATGTTKSLAECAIAFGDAADGILADAEIVCDPAITAPSAISAMSFGASRSDLGRSPV